MIKAGNTDKGGSAGSGNESGIWAISDTVATESQSNKGTSNEATIRATTMPKLLSRVFSKAMMSRIVAMPTMSVGKSTLSRFRNRSIVWVTLFAPVYRNP